MTSPRDYQDSDMSSSVYVGTQYGDSTIRHIDDKGKD